MVEMKDSGIEWIGEIPKDWGISKLKHLGEYINGYAFKPNDWGDDGKRIIRIQDLTGTNDSPNYYNGEIDSKYLVSQGDILVSWAATLDAFIWDKEESWLNQHIFKAIPNKEKVSYDFFFWMIKIAMQNMNNDNKHGIFMQHVTLGAFGNYSVPLPPIEKQQRIANFLDFKSTEINTLISDIQSEIETLEEYKKSVITEAVTKGLNPNAEMKDSGIEWVGEIPTTWNIHPVYYYFGERRNKNYALAEQNLLSLSYGRVIRKSIDTVGGLLPASFNTYNIVEAGDIIIRPTDLQNDKRSLRTGLVTELGIITSAYIDLMPKENVNSEYFHYLLHAYDIQKVFYNMGNGVRQGLNYSEFSKLMVIAPPVTEQAQIVEYLDAKCKEINDIINEKKNQLEVLDQYKKSLIYEYVTGKKEL